MTLEIRSHAVQYIDLSKGDPMRDRVKVTLTDEMVISLAPTNPAYPSATPYTLQVVFSECSPQFWDYAARVMTTMVNERRGLFRRPLAVEDVRARMRAITYVWHPELESFYELDEQPAAGQELQLWLSVPGFRASEQRSMGNIATIDIIEVSHTQVASWNIS